MYPHDVRRAASSRRCDLQRCRTRRADRDRYSTVSGHALPQELRAGHRAREDRHRAPSRWNRQHDERQPSRSTWREVEDLRARPTTESHELECLRRIEAPMVATERTWTAARSMDQLAGVRCLSASKLLHGRRVWRTTELVVARCLLDSGRGVGGQCARPVWPQLFTRRALRSPLRNARSPRGA